VDNKGEKMENKKDNKWLNTDVITKENPIDESKYTLSKLTALDWLSKTGDFCLEMLGKHNFDIESFDTVAHEITHAILDEKIEKPHGREFSSIVKSVFKLGGVPKSTQPTYSMVKLFEQFVAENGLYPHVAYKPTRKKQTTRNIKVACLNLQCGGATKSSLKQDRGAIFRISSASVEKAQDNGDKITCPICQGDCEVGDLVYGNYQGTV
jgi:hypothetical protein